MDRLPSLTALRAFEAAARHLSFAKAAEELFVTPAALSYQIKSLETELGLPLFHRLNRAVTLTEAGRALAPGTTDGFTTLLSAWRKAKRLNENKILTVTAGPALTSKWLAPRMFEFAQAHPEIEMRFSASLHIVDFDHDEVDVAIRFGMGGHKNLYSKPLIKEWLTPMMTPEMAAELKGDLSRAVLIHDETLRFAKAPCDWAAWTRAAGMELDTSQGPLFSQADHALDAAISGAGVALGRFSVAMKDLETGRLVAPFKIGLVAEAQVWFVCPEGTETRPQVQAFEAWIRKEVGAASKFEEGRTLIRASDIPRPN